MKEKAVITGDIINFTALDAEKRQSLIRDTESLLKAWTVKKSNAEIFRGDSYQILFDDIPQALNRSIQLICWFKQYSKDERTELGTRISIGIGTVAYSGKNVLDSDGEAFHLSGRNFDTMKAGDYLTIHTGNPKKNEGLEILLNFMNKYMQNWTAAQTEVIFLILEGKTQQEIAGTLQLSQPSVNSRLKLAGWKEFEPTLKYIADLVQKD